MAVLIKLYGGTRTRATIVQWYLEELGLDYEYILLDLKNKEHLQPEYLAINPMGKVPSLVDRDLKVWESGAILLYLSDKYGNNNQSSESRALMSQWVLFANSTLGNALFIEDIKEKELPRLLTSLDKILQEQSFLVGDSLTVADIAVGSYLSYGKLLLAIDFKDYPSIEDYLNRLFTREAFKNTLGKR